MEHIMTILFLMYTRIKPPVFRKDIYLGTYGEDIELLQDFLISHGDLKIPEYMLKGRMNILTQSALIKYKERHYIYESELFGPKTREHVNNTINRCRESVILKPHLSRAVR